MTWNPDQYEKFADHRFRPGYDLLARVPAIEPRRVIDLGCGTGALTEVLAHRWPDAAVVGLDSSTDMLGRVPTGIGNVEWRVGDIGSFHAAEPYDVIFSNAALHWLDDHERLFRRLADSLAPRGVLAVQMPDSWAEPSHRIPADILEGGDFSPVSRTALLRNRVSAPGDYRSWIGPDMEIDMWTTTYHQVLPGKDPVLAWVLGTVLPPVLETLDEAGRTLLVEECARRYRLAYPPEADGATVLPFRRLFIVAQRR